VQALEVDCTKFLVVVLADAVTDPVTNTVARIVTELPGADNAGGDALLAAVPVIRVVRVGGPNDGRVLDAATVVLHGFVAKPNQGHRLLHAAQTALYAAVGRVVTVDGGQAVMTRLRMLSGPSYAPYENTALRHSVMTIQPRIKITR
jgi:hypothetical protein